MKNTKLILFFSMFFSIIFLFSGIALGATPSSCAYYVNESVTFDSDLNCLALQDALLLNGNNLVIDCAGHTINGSYGGIVFNTSMSSFTNITIQNCEMTNLDWNGIRLKYVDGLRINNINITNISSNSLSLENISNSLIENIIINNSIESYDAIFIDNLGDNNTFKDIELYNINLTDYDNFYIWIEETTPSDQLLFDNIYFDSQRKEFYVEAGDYLRSTNINISNMPRDTSVSIGYRYDAWGTDYNYVRFNETDLFYSRDYVMDGKDFISINSSTNLNKSADIAFKAVAGCNYNYTIYVNYSNFPQTNLSIFNGSMYQTNLTCNFDLNEDGTNDSILISVSHFSGYAIDSYLDTDGDGINNPIDNCVNVSNPTQTDTDGDGIGDVCDPTPGTSTTSSSSSDNPEEYNMTPDLNKYNIFESEALREKDSLTHNFEGELYEFILKDISYTKKQTTLRLEPSGDYFTFDLDNTVFFDLNEDETDDISMLLTDLTFSRVWITAENVKEEILEEVIVEEEPVQEQQTEEPKIEPVVEEIQETPQTQETEGEIVVDISNKNYSWIYWVVLLIILAGLGILYYYKKTNKPKRKHK